MATVDCSSDCDFEFDEPPREPVRPSHEVVPGRHPVHRALHRIAEVRQQQQVSLRRAARLLGLSISEVRRQERSVSDLTVSQLLRWQQVLEVPVAELLVEAEGQLAGPVLERSRMVRLMKTAAAIRERTRGTAAARLVTMLIEQVVELMPEVEGVTPWPGAGQPRRRDDFGRAAECPMPDAFFRP